MTRAGLVTRAAACGLLLALPPVKPPVSPAAIGMPRSRVLFATLPNVSNDADEVHIAASSQTSGVRGPAGDSHSDQLSDLEDLARMHLLGESTVRPPQTRRRRKQASSAAEDLPTDDLMSQPDERHPGHVALSSQMPTAPNSADGHAEDNGLF